MFVKFSDWKQFTLNKIIKIKKKKTYSTKNSIKWAMHKL